MKKENIANKYNEPDNIMLLSDEELEKMYDLDGNLEDGDLKFATKELKPRKARSLRSYSLFLTLTSSS